MTRHLNELDRRQFLQRGVGAAAMCLGFSPLAAAAQTADLGHENGINPPRAVPDVALRCSDGTSRSLQHLLRGRATALHFMFASCRTVCPIQGAVFHRVQEMLPDATARSLQLLSISVDPEHDTNAVLSNWLQHYHAQPGWTAAVADADQLTKLRQFFVGQEEQASHSTQVYIVNRRAEWIWRTSALPSAEVVAGLLRKMAV